MRRRLASPLSCLALLAAACFADRGPPADLGESTGTTGEFVDPALVQLCADNFANRAAIAEAQCQCQVDQGVYPDLVACRAANGGEAAVQTCACDTYGAHPEVRPALECAVPAQTTALACLTGVTCVDGTDAYDACLSPYVTAASACGGPPKDLRGEVALRCDGVAPFACGSGEEVPDTWRCNLESDCEDLSDEQGCEHSYVCSDGITFIPDRYRCDNIVDCPDSGDEKECPTFQCLSGMTIPEPLRCDGFPDCQDGSDEMACAMFMCTSGAEILERRRCDTYPDCQDGSDELGCPTFLCGDGTEIPQPFVCDYQPDCPAREDEAGCVPFKCFSGVTQPATASCDGVQDCATGEDEDSCPFVCEGFKIGPEYVCDGVPDCLDSADEVDCKGP